MIKTIRGLITVGGFMLLLALAVNGVYDIPRALACNCTVTPSEIFSVGDNASVVQRLPLEPVDALQIQDSVIIQIHDPSGPPTQPPIDSGDEFGAGEDLGDGGAFAFLYTSLAMPFFFVLAFGAIFVGIGTDQKVIGGVMIFIAMGLAWVGIFGHNSNWIILLGLVVTAGAIAVTISRWLGGSDN